MSGRTDMAILGGDHQSSNTSLSCPCCGRVTCHPDDIKNGYCAACHWYTSDPELGPPHLQAACTERTDAANSRRP
jgi:ribosomal protein L37E